MKAQCNRVLTWLRTFFINYLWLGVVLVLAAIVLDLQFPAQPQRQLGLSILIRFLESVGIAVLVAAIFTFASGTSQFMSKIRSLLQDIVLSRAFLGNIDNESKKEALRAIIRPSAEEQKIYSNLEDYYNTYIDQTLSISRKCVRSNYNVVCVVRYDSAKNRVITRETATYRLYPTTEGYTDIEVGFYDYEETFPPACEHVIVSAPNGQRVVRKPFDLKVEERRGQKCLFGKLNLRDIGRDMSHLDVEMSCAMFEHDHWATIGFQALQPTDGFRYQLICEDGVEIRSVNVFTYGVDVLVDQKGKTELLISCTQWLNEGAGLSLVVSRDNRGSEQAAGADPAGRGPAQP